MVGSRVRHRKRHILAHAQTQFFENPWICTSLVRVIVQHYTIHAEMDNSPHRLYLYSKRGYTCMYARMNKVFVLSVHVDAICTTTVFSNGAWNAQRHAKRMSPEQESLRGPFFSTGWMARTLTCLFLYRDSCFHEDRTRNFRVKVGHPSHYTTAAVHSFYFERDLYC